MNDKVRGFVLSISDYKEADVLMQVITNEYGIISLVGKASKKLNSKNHFLPMCEYEFIIDYKQGKSIYSIHGYKLLNSYFEDNDVLLMSFKNILIEATLKNKDISCYSQLLFCFEKINRNNMYLIGSLYFSYLIKKFGITPIVDSCAICSNKHVVSISNYHGGFLCSNHLNGEKIIDVDRLKKFRLIIKADFCNYEILKDFVYDYIDFKYVVSFFLNNADLKLKAYDFHLSLI